MRFRVGDKVKVRDGLEADKMYGGDHVMPEMVGKCGCVATVTAVSYSYYSLDVDDGEWCWTEEMVEEVGEMEDKKYINFEIPEWVNWLARDNGGDLYGYRNKPRKHMGSWSIGNVCSGINTWLVSTDPNHYPQVKWSDEEPKQYKDGITFLTGTSKAETYHNYPANPPEPDMIQNPPHYKQYSFEPIDIITEVVKEYPSEIGFHIGTTLKYLFRSPFKGNLPQDLEKAGYYLQRANKELTEE